MKSECIKIYVVRKSTWRSTPSELRFFERLAWKLKSKCFQIYCAESQRGDQPLQSCVFFERLAWKLKSECIQIYFPERQRGDQPLQSCVFFERLAWKLKSKCIQIYCPESQLGDQPLQSYVFFWEEGMLCLEIEERMQSKQQLLAQKLKKIAYVWFSGEMKSECIRIYVVGKINMAINSFRAAFILRGRNALLGNWRANVFKYVLSGKATWRSTTSELHFYYFFFFERKDHLSWKFKKLAYVSYSGEMRTKCIRIYIVVVTRTDFLHMAICYVNWYIKL